jgi:hypothetical protein
LIGPHECPITRTEEKLRIDEGTEQRVTRSAVEAPQPLRLRRRQPQSRHFAILALNLSQYVVKRLLCFHEPSPFSRLDDGAVCDGATRMPAIRSQPAFRGIAR